LETSKTALANPHAALINLKTSVTRNAFAQAQMRQATTSETVTTTGIANAIANLANTALPDKKMVL
jgi:hypothetical protein